MYLGMGDERQHLIPGSVAWIDIRGNLLFEVLVEAFNEAICLQMVHGRKYLLET